MAHITGFDALRYGEIVQAVDGSTAFSVDQAPVEGRAKLSTLANGDTVMYRAVAEDDPSKWEVGLGTYASATKTLARTTILASSNSDNAVDFTKADGSGGNVRVLGLSGIVTTANAYTVTNISSASRSISATEATAGNIAAALAALVQDLAAAGFIKASVS